MRQSTTRIAVLLAASLALLVACGDGDGAPDQSTETPVTTESAAPPPVEPPPVEPPAVCLFEPIEVPQEGKVTAPRVPVPGRLGDATDEASAYAYLYEGASFVAVRTADCNTGVRYFVVIPDEWVTPELAAIRIGGNTTLG